MWSQTYIYIYIYSNYNGDKSTLFTTSCRKNGSKKLVSNSLTTNKSKLLEEETTGFIPQPHEFPANVRLNQFLESTGLTNEYLNSSIWVSNGFPRSRWRQAGEPKLSVPARIDTSQVQHSQKKTDGAEDRDGWGMWQWWKWGKRWWGLWHVYPWVYLCMQTNPPKWKPCRAREKPQNCRQQLFEPLPVGSIKMNPFIVGKKKACGNCCKHEITIEFAVPYV